MTNAARTTPFIIDAHACPPFAADKDLAGLQTYKDAGVTLVSVNVGYGDMKSAEVLAILKRFNQYLSTQTMSFKLINKTEELDNLQAHNQLGITFDLEGAHALDDNLDLLDEYYRLGVRQMLLAYNKNSPAAGGCLDNDTGLTSFGKEIIQRMNTLGIVVDCSHTGYRSTIDIMETSSKPVVFSHANPKKFCDHPRNISDDQIKLCSETNGVIGINGISIFLGCKKPTAAKLAEHIDYVAQLVGIEHVGIGLDYVLDHDEVKAAAKATPHLFPEDQGFNEVKLLSPGSIPLIANELTKRGYKNENIQAVLGLNFLRVINESW